MRYLILLSFVIFSLSCSNGSKDICGSSHLDGNFVQIQGIDTFLSLKNYDPSGETVPTPEYVDFSLSIKVYETKTSYQLSADSLQFLNEDIEYRKKKMELSFCFLNTKDNFRDTKDTLSYLIDEEYIQRTWKTFWKYGNESLSFLNNAYLIDVLPIKYNESRIKISLVYGIENTDKIYMCPFWIDAWGISGHVGVYKYYN